MDFIAILDFGSQYSQLIARRIRELNVYCELFPHGTPAEEVIIPGLKGFVLSGGPASVYEAGAPQLPAFLLNSGLPVLGICYGMQALTHTLGGRVAPSREREYGSADIEVVQGGKLLKGGNQQVWMSHGDRIEQPPEGYQVLAKSKNSPVAAIGDLSNHRYGLQFHPEVRHTPSGTDILRAFVLDICGAQPEWTPHSIIESSLKSIQQQVGSEPVLSAVSGGVDSTVATTLVHRAVGDQLKAIFVNTGLLRRGEAERVVEVLADTLGIPLITLQAAETFLEALEGVVDPERKREIIGERFIRLFEDQASALGEIKFLVQGTIYPDVVESSGPGRQLAARIKTHHNVGGLPEKMAFELVEPLRFLFKDEVREVGRELGLPEDLILRQPFPGPGLAVRCLGEVSLERIERLQRADQIVREVLEGAGLYPEGTDQAFAVLLPLRTVGVMGDQRTYAEVVAVRAVTTDDFMTADWAQVPHPILAEMSQRIVNEVQGVNRVVYDVTSKPPATIEWE